MNKSCLFFLIKKCELLLCVDLEAVNGKIKVIIHSFLFKDYLIFILILLVHKEREGFYVWENINKRFKKKKRNKYNLAYIHDSCSYVCGK